jgi:DUF1680 family protein
MRTTATRLLLLLSLSVTGGAAAQGVQEVSWFPLEDVRLLEGPFLEAQQTDGRYIMALEPDRLLAPFLREAGLTPRAESYPNWENTGLDGHIGGHYLSALAMLWASTGDEAVRKRLDYMLAELRRAQTAAGDGFLGGTPGSRELWAQIRAGDIRAAGFDLNGKWVPLYNIHKTYAGLRDAWLHAGSDLARTMLVELTDWMAGVTAGLTDAQMQDMLRSEHGGLNETFADVAAITGQGKYLELARRFSHRVILDPLVKGEDRLTGMHANTQIPKVIGYERIARLSGSDPTRASDAAEWDRAARFFWETVVENRSVVIGGNSAREHFHPVDDYTQMLEDVQGPETCNTYNMLRLTKMLFETTPTTRFADYYERALYNHILASQHPEHGGFVYFTPMRPGHYRVYSQPDTSMWCCVGSGIENHTKYGEFVYARSTDAQGKAAALWVNLFIPSRVEWREQGVALVQKTAFPDEEKILLTVEKSNRKPFTLKLRYPGWARGVKLSVNGRVQRVDAQPGEYIALDRRWRAGDEIALEFDMEVTAVRIPDGKDYWAFMYGPVVLASPMGTDDVEGLRAGDGRMAHVARGRRIPAEGIPVLETSPESLPALLRKTNDDRLTFTLTDGREFIPFFRLHDARYAIYLPNKNN